MRNKDKNVSKEKSLNPLIPRKKTKYFWVEFIYEID